LTRPETIPGLLLGVLLIFLGLLPFILSRPSPEPLPSSFYLLEYLLMFGLITSGLMVIFWRRSTK
jgi:hypothetical protein